jgi:hypothetical protein
VLIRLQGRPFTAGTDSSDIDVYVLGVPGSTGNVNEVGSSTNVGSTEDLTLALPQGSYYLAVVDYAGVVERYSMCIREIKALTVSSCNLILPGPPAPGPLRTKSRPQPSAGTSTFGRGSFLLPRQRQ